MTLNHLIYNKIIIRIAHPLLGAKVYKRSMMTSRGVLAKYANNYTSTNQPNILLNNSTNATGQSKPQRLAELQDKRLHQLSDKNTIFEEDSDATKFINQPSIKAAVETAIKNSPKNRHQVVRYENADPSFYTEEGLAHKDAEAANRSKWFEDNTENKNTTNLDEVD